MRILRRVFAAALVLSAAGFAVSTESKAGSAEKAQAVPATKLATLEGKVTSKDKNRLTVNSTPIGVTDATKFTVDGASVEWQAIKVDDSVKVRYAPLSDAVVGTAIDVAASREKMKPLTDGISHSSGDKGKWVKGCPPNPCNMGVGNLGPAGKYHWVEG